MWDTKELSGEGPLDAKICFVIDAPHRGDESAGSLMSDYAGDLFWRHMRFGGINRAKCRIEPISKAIPPDGKFYYLHEDKQEHYKHDCLKRLQECNANVFVPVGQTALDLLTGETQIQKWHMSIMKGFNGKKAIPVLSPSHVMRMYKDHFFLRLSAFRISEEAQFADFRLPKRELIINSQADEVFSFLKECQQSEWLSVDIETFEGQITCVGFAPSAMRSMSVITQPEHWDEKTQFQIWLEIQKTLLSSAKKIFQNGIYDLTYFAKYGIRVKNFVCGHDTMIAQRLLNPELSQSLATIAKIYTKEPYWKDEGKLHTTKASMDSYYTYNAKDAAVTYEAAMAQRRELEQRGLLDFFQNFEMRKTLVAHEMSWRGLPLDLKKLEEIRNKTAEEHLQLKRDFDAEVTEIMGGPINPRSPAQVKTLLKACKFRLPVKRGKETTDVLALKKLRLKHPDSKILTQLLKLSETQKETSSYLNFDYDIDHCVRFSLYVSGTEMGRMSCGKDPWDRGFNAQTVPAKMKPYVAAPKGQKLINIDLVRADAHFVAWDSGDAKLLELYRQGVDVYKYVAIQPELFNCSMEEVTKKQRDLTKRVNHAANYGMLAATLQDTCLRQMDLALTYREAESALEGYHRLFPGVHAWQKRIRTHVTQKRYLTNPFGRIRYFYDRADDNMFREAYAYRPASAVADITNHLCLYMFGHAQMRVQVHDSLLITADEDKVLPTIERIKQQDNWNPKMQLLGGELRIPIEISIGQNWKEMETVFKG